METIVNINNKNKTKKSVPNKKEVATKEEKENVFEHLANFIASVAESLNVQAGAVQRLEMTIFPLVRLLIDKNVITYDELQMAMHGLLQSNDLLAYWGVRPESVGLQADVEEVAEAEEQEIDQCDDPDVA